MAPRRCRRAQAQLPVTAVTHIKGKDPKEKERDKEKERERERAAANAVKQQLAAQPGLQCGPDLRVPPPVTHSVLKCAQSSGLARARSVILEDDTSPEKQEKPPRKSSDQARAGKDPPTPTGRGPAAAALPLPLRTDAAPLAEAAAGARGVAGYPGSPVSAMSDVRPARAAAPAPACHCSCWQLIEVRVAGAQEDALQQRLGSGASAQPAAGGARAVLLCAARVRPGDAPTHGCLVAAQSSRSGRRRGRCHCRRTAARRARRSRRRRPRRRRQRPRKSSSSRWRRPAPLRKVQAVSLALGRLHVALP